MKPKYFTVHVFGDTVLNNDVWTQFLFCDPHLKCAVSRINISQCQYHCSPSDQIDPSGFSYTLSAQYNRIRTCFQAFLYIKEIVPSETWRLSSMTNQCGLFIFLFIYTMIKTTVKPAFSVSFEPQMDRLFGLSCGGDADMVNSVCFTSKASIKCFEVCWHQTSANLKTFHFNEHNRTKVVISQLTEHCSDFFASAS